MEQTESNNIMLYLMLIISCSLISMNSIEIYHLSIHWKNLASINSVFSNTCIKPQFFVKLFFTIFSFLASFSCLVLVIGLLIDFYYFTEKILQSFFNFIFYVFGPTLLACCIFGLIHWEESVYTCGRNFEGKPTKNFNFQNASSIIFCLVIALVFTFAIEYFKVMNLYTDTITNNEGGNKFLKIIFWKVCAKLNRRENNNLNSARSINNNNSNNNSTDENESVRNNISIRENNNLNNEVVEV